MKIKLLKIIKKDFKILLRSKASALIILFGPLLLILLVGVAFNTSSLYDIKVGSYSESYSELSNSIIAKLEGDQYQVVKTESMESCIEGVKLGIYHICVEFPANLEIKEGTKNTIKFSVDQSRMNLIYAIKGVILNKVTERSKEISGELTQVLVDKLHASSDDLQQGLKDVDTLSSTFTEINIEIIDAGANLDVLELNFSDLDEKLTKILYDSNDLSGKLNETAYAEDFLDLLGDINSYSKKVKERADEIGTGVGKVKGTLNTLETTLGQGNTQLKNLRLTSLDIIDSIRAIEVNDVESIVSPIRTETESVTAEKKTVNFLFPTLVMMVVMFVSLLLSAVTVIREKLSSAYFRNFISPTNNGIFILGTFLTNIIIVMIQLVVVFSVMAAFQPDIVATLLNVALVILLIASAFILLGMIIGYVFNSEETATLGAVSVGSILLVFSNTIFPLETIPTAIRQIVNYNLFVIGDDILKKLILFQTGLASVEMRIYALVAYILLFLLAILIIFKSAQEIYNIKRHLQGK